VKRPKPALEICVTIGIIRQISDHDASAVIARVALILTDSGLRYTDSIPLEVAMSKLRSLTVLFSVWMLGMPSCGSGEEQDAASGGAGAAGSGGQEQGGTGAGTTGGGGSGGSGGAEQGGTGGSGGEGNFDPNNPGIRMTFTVGVALLMGQPATFAAGAFLPTAREDLEAGPNQPSVPLGSCEETTTTYTPTCTGPQDCAPEQQCLPETDMNGKPIANSESCVTPRSPIDVGPFTMTGFASGPKTLSYNAQQKGAYTTPGGDGTIPYGDLGFDRIYEFEGAGDASKGLGSFHGKVRLGPEFRLTSPSMVSLPIGVDGIQVSVSQDLALTWSGADQDKELTITLTGATMNGQSHTITCRTMDTGAFTIPAAKVQAAQLGDMAFLNMLTFERNERGEATGEGMTSHDISTMQTAVINVAKLP